MMKIPGKWAWCGFGVGFVAVLGVAVLIGQGLLFDRPAPMDALAQSAGTSNAGPADAPEQPLIMEQSVDVAPPMVIDRIEDLAPHLLEEQGQNEGTFDDTVADEPAVAAETLTRRILDNGFAGSAGDQQQLLDLASRNDDALRSVLDLYRNHPDSPGASALALVLGEIQDPKVEALGQELAESSDRTEKLRGLELLGTLAIPSQRTFNIALGTMQSGVEDPELVMSAMYALPKMTMSGSDNQALLGTFSTLSSHSHEGVRSASLFKIGEWAKTPSDILPLVAALESETNDDRISAAMAIQTSHVVSDALRDQLVARMTDVEELWEVRAMAAASLERFDLNGDQFDKFQQFRRNQNAVVTEAPQ